MVHSSAETVQLIEADGMKLSVAVRAGAAGRTPLVCFNGIGARQEMLAPFLDALGSTLPSLRFDPPGIGGSPAPAWPYRFAGLARAINELCDRQGWGEVDVFGISWGGAMAQQFARQHGRRTRRLILAATSAGMVSFPGKVSALLEMAGPLRHLRPGRTKGGSAGVIYGGEFRRNLALARKVAPFFADAGSSGYYFQVLAGAG